MTLVLAERAIIEQARPFTSPETKLVTALAERSDAVRKAVEKLLTLETPAAFLHEQDLVLADGGLEVPDWTRGKTRIMAGNDLRPTDFRLFTEPRYVAFRAAYPGVDAESKVWLEEFTDKKLAKFGGTRNGQIYTGETGENHSYSRRGYRRTWSTPVGEEARPSIEEILNRFRDQGVEAK